MGKSGNPARRAEAEQLDELETEQVETSDEGNVEDFDAFWTTRKRKRRTTTIMGERVTLPASLPLQFELEARKRAKSTKDKDVRKLVAILFGEGALARWAERGMDLEQFSVLLAWAPQVIAGENVTLREVADELEAMDHDSGEDGEDDADPS